MRAKSSSVTVWQQFDAIVRALLCKTWTMMKGREGEMAGFHTGFFVGEGKKRSRRVTHANT